MTFGDRGERRGIDLRTFTSRDDAATAPPISDRTLELICVRDLEAMVDRRALLAMPSSVEPPYWALPWIGARAIASAMSLRPPVATARVLDLGCGLGLSGIAAGLSGAHVVFADHVEAALGFAHANAVLHALPCFETLRVDFTTDRLDRVFDWILAADIVYDPSHYEPLVDFLDAHLAPNGTVLLTESLRADARRVIDLLAARRIDGDKTRLWLLEEGRPELTWLHTLARS